MKILPCLYLLLLISIFIGCSSDSDSNLAIDFCESYEADATCKNSDNTFEIGTPVYVHFTSSTPFEEKIVIGRIVRVLEDGQKQELGLKKFDVVPETTYLVQSIPFQDFGQNAIGTFLITFSKEDEQVLAQRELKIVEKFNSNQ